jgi:hypothetical protein
MMMYQTHNQSTLVDSHRQMAIDISCMMLVVNISIRICGCPVISLSVHIHQAVQAGGIYHKGYIP